MREDLRIRNLAAYAVRITLALRVAANFADLFEVKHRRVRPRGGLSTRANGDTLTISYHREGLHRGVRVVATGSTASLEGLHFDVSLPPHGQWETSVLVHWHDLRHAGLTYVAGTGASLTQIMHRGGHSTVTAAMNSSTLPRSTTATSRRSCPTGRSRCPTRGSPVRSGS